MSGQPDSLWKTGTLLLFCLVLFLFLLFQGPLLGALAIGFVLFAAYGLTPKAYMDRLRLREAKRLLATTDSKIIDIAASVGFGSLATFNRFFKEQTGGTPTKYRSEMRHKGPAAL